MENYINEHIQHQLLKQMTNNAVLAVPACELGDAKVETLLAMLTTHSADELKENLSVKMLNFKELTHSSIDEKWHLILLACIIHRAQVVVKILGESLGSDGRLPVYAVFNIGRECWCVLTSNYRTVDDMRFKSWMNTNSQRSYARLIPRARASQRIHWCEETLFRDFLGEPTVQIKAKFVAN